MPTEATATKTPKIPKTVTPRSTRTPFKVYFPEDLHRRLRMTAAERNVKMSDVLNELVNTLPPVSPFTQR